MPALLWPLFFAACEVVSPEGRDLALKSIEAIVRVQGLVHCAGSVVTSGREQVQGKLDKITGDGDLWRVS